MDNRFWVGGPCQDKFGECWLVLDGNDFPGVTARKPAGFIPVWRKEDAAQRHAQQLNDQERRK